MAAAAPPAPLRRQQAQREHVPLLQAPPLPPPPPLQPALNASWPGVGGSAALPLAPRAQSTPLSGLRALQLAPQADEGRQVDAALLGLRLA